MVPKLGLLLKLLKPGAKGGGPDAEGLSGAPSSAIAGVSGAIELSLGPGKLSVRGLRTHHTSLDEPWHSDDSWPQQDPVISVFREAPEIFKKLERCRFSIC